MKVQKPGTTDHELTVTMDHGWNSGTMGLSTYRTRSNITLAVILFLGAVAGSGIVLLVLLLLGSAPLKVQVEPGQAPSPSSVSLDPYDLYLRFAPSSAPYLSREDAQARAYLGCGVEWAPGTVDAALAHAYRPTGICS